MINLIGAFVRKVLTRQSNFLHDFQTIQRDVCGNTEKSEGRYLTFEYMGFLDIRNERTTKNIALPVLHS